MASSTKRKTTGNNRNASSKRLATSAEDNLQGRVCTIPISADAFIHELKERIHRQNASQLTGVDPAMLDAYSTNDPRLGWARVSANGGMIGRGNPMSESFLHPSKRVRDYFPSNIPPADSGVVHVVVNFIIQPSVGSQVNEIGTMPLDDDKPLHGEDADYDDDGTFQEEMQRWSRVREALGLSVHWSMRGTDFSKEHDYQGAKWLECGGWWDHQRPSRVYIGDKTTWRELYIASNEALQKEGQEVWVEGFKRVEDGPTLRLCIGT